MIKENCLIGYTGFVGSSLSSLTSFEYKINRSNIQTMFGKEFDLVVCCGLPAEKWKANKFPNDDYLNTMKLIDGLSQIKANKFTLISTVDIYENPFNCNEDSVFNISKSAYGNNRHILELFVEKNFSNYQIVRLPGLFGKGLKKNIIFDLLNNQAINVLPNNTYQWYPIASLPEHLKIIANNRLIKKINISTEPISSRELIDECFNKALVGEFTKPDVTYDVKSKYSFIFSCNSSYIFSKSEIFRHIKNFLKSYNY
jgi:nucleoside-diphosphate-sugar epimerase